MASVARWRSVIRTFVIFYTTYQANATRGSRIVFNRWYRVTIGGEGGIPPAAG